MNHITLCMIAGREAAHIETCLRAFAPAFDSLSLVIALGNQEPDDTAKIARAVCFELDKPITVDHYKNGSDAHDWPHVDDFAAARDMSFIQGLEIAPDWLFWADCDDTVDPRTPIEELRTIAASGKADAYGFAYDVVGTGKRPIRERLFRAELFKSGKCSWSGAIHENVVGEKVMAMDSPVWRHSPHASKPLSKDRNMRILKGQMANAALNAFYIHQEHAIKGEWEEAKTWGDAAMALPNLPNSFRYEIALNNVRKGPRRDAEAWAARAFALYPQCREALAFLALLRMEEGRMTDALALVERMGHVPPPAAELRPWCYDGKWYGWGHFDLLARLLRINGRQAEEAEDAIHGGKMPLISLIHATRGRHNAALACRERWLNLAEDPATIETVWCVDSDDHESVTVAKQFRHVVVEAGGGCVRAWNEGAEIARGKIFVQLSDDWQPSQGWDRAILAELSLAGKSLDEPFVVAVGDGVRTDGLLCMAILSRARWQRQGRKMFSDEYKSVYSDNEFTHRAWRDGVVIDARKRITFEHMHPAFGKGETDKTYAESNSKERYAEGEAVFRRRNPDAA
jgi:tetratricopeptide (TPR) repeat protein